MGHKSEYLYGYISSARYRMILFCSRRGLGIFYWFWCGPMEFGSLKSLSYFLVIAFAAALAFPVNASAMHIAEGYLPPGWCVAWGVLSAPFLIAGFGSVKKRLEAAPKSVILLALCGAYVFLLSSMKLPSVTGSSSHPTGVGLCAVIFGPAAATVISVIVLLFQALLLAHGGLTTLGANLFSMGIAGPFAAFGLYKLITKLGGRISVAVFAAAALGDISTYIFASFQLALAHHEKSAVFLQFIEYLAVFALTQIPLAAAEGLLTVIIFDVIRKYQSGGSEHAQT